MFPDLRAGFSRGRSGGLVFPSLSEFSTVYCINIYAEYIIRNIGLEEAQAGIKTAGRNINNIRYPDDTTFMAESEEELKSLLIKVKEESGLLLSY